MVKTQTQKNGPTGSTPRGGGTNPGIGPHPTTGASNGTNRQLMFKLLYQRPTMADSLPIDKWQPFRDLLDLLRENGTIQIQRQSIRNNWTRYLPRPNNLEYFANRSLISWRWTTRSPLLCTSLPKLQSFTRDSMHLIEKLDNAVFPDGTIIVSLDVESHQYWPSVNFLDLQITLHEDTIFTDLHRKLTATNSLLHYDSFHQKHLKDGIPMGQFARLRRNCSKDTDFFKQASDLTGRFQPMTLHWEL